RPELKAASILAAVLDKLSPIWPLPMGDVWQHAAIGWVPFHKLSQWLSYSLVEPLEGAGLKVVALDRLTGLPEYRNGGLLVDSGALRPKQRVLIEKTFAVGDEPIVEWRALTVALLDRIAQQVRDGLGLDAERLPLVKVLEAGTWFAGRKLAAERRSGGGPPISVASDGTVFSIGFWLRSRRIEEDADFIFLPSEAGEAYQFVGERSKMSLPDSIHVV